MNEKQFAKEWFYKTINEFTNINEKSNLEVCFETLWKEYITLKEFKKR